MSKIKDFQEFIKQDFDVVEDYKASKEMTPKNNLDKAISILNSIFEECGDSRINNVLDLLVKPFESLIELEKKNTPMKPYWEHAYICNNCSNEFVEKTDKYCSNCGQKLDWSGDNKPLQNESGE
jgi:DNA-directed RNA polymerase subunit RPC12/RpoP